MKQLLIIVLRLRIMPDHFSALTGTPLSVGQPALLLIPPRGDGLACSLLPGLQSLLSVHTPWDVFDYAGRLLSCATPPLEPAAYRWIFVVACEKNPDKHEYFRLRKSILSRADRRQVIILDGSDLPGVDLSLAARSSWYFKRELRRAPLPWQKLAYLCLASIPGCRLRPLQFAQEERYLPPVNASPPGSWDERRTYLCCPMSGQALILKRPRARALSRQLILDTCSRWAEAHPAVACSLGPVPREGEHPRHNPAFYRLLSQSRIAINAFGRGIDCFRFYEITARGCALFSQPIDEFLVSAAALTAGRHYVSFRSAAELAEKLTYYRSHENELAEIARQGQQQSANIFSAAARTRYLLDTISCPSGKQA